MRNLGDIINDYKKGIPFSKLDIEELISIGCANKMLEKVSKCMTKFEDFETSEYEVNEYLWELHEMEQDYYKIKDEMRDDGNRLIIFELIVGSFICYLIYEITNYMSFALWIVVLIITYYLPFQFFEGLYENFKIKRLFKKNGFVRKKNVEDFVNEIMYQIYIENRNPKLEKEFKNKWKI